MDNRREFIKKSILLSGVAGLSTIMPASVQRAFAIDPVPGSTYLDAEHVVILMQENRSFDHCFGTLQGVRGFNDPRAITLPDMNPVWLQSSAVGGTYTPFRFNIRDTNITWMGCLPHGRGDQVDANNFGKHDKWIDVKHSYYLKYAGLPLTMGYYTREDIPFNYALADAFTICDQNFCSAMTSTYPNRLYFMSGTIREQQNADAMANIRNENMGYGKFHWTSFPERLQENDIAWKVYQNDIDCGGGFTGEERAWLSNLGCNVLEYFANYNVKFSPRYIKGLQNQVNTLPADINTLKAKLSSMPATDKDYKKTQTDLQIKQQVLDNAKNDLIKYSSENYEKLSKTDKELYQRAFTVNDGDPFYHEITALSYTDAGTERKLTIPKGDILHQFRQDVDSGQLPTVSWLVAPTNFSDHPAAPWYGAWYVSEILDILTKDPEVWKKTIFILAYDENDGYFDHVPPFISPDPLNPETGKCSADINFDVEYIRKAHEIKQGVAEKGARENSIGLGFRVPLIIASPWSRGGQVCSQVFDHTSTLQFLEDFLSKKFDKNIREDNISKWRRAVCGNLTAAFRPYNGEKVQLPFLEKIPFIEQIHKAQFKNEPSSKKLTAEEIEKIKNDRYSALLPQQEPGIRPANALPYQLYVDGNLNHGKKSFEIGMTAGNEVFGERSAGSPFNIYAYGKYSSQNKEKDQPATSEILRCWNYAVNAGNTLADAWAIDNFENGLYQLGVYGPNGFFREFKGSIDDPFVTINCEYERNPIYKKKLTGNILLKLASLNHKQEYTIVIKDNAYKNHTVKKVLKTKGSQNVATVAINLFKSFGWYDFSIYAEGFEHFEKRFAGRVETGKNSYTDPAMGRS